MNLETKIYEIWIGIVPRKKSCLSADVLLINGETARMFIHLQEITPIDALIVVEHEHADPHLEDQGQFRVEFTFDLQGGG